MLIQRTMYVIALLAMCSMLTSCAALIMGSKQKIEVSSDPAGAKISLNGVDQQAFTPAKIKVKRSSAPHMIKLEKDGFETTQTAISSRFNGLVLLDFFMFMIPAVVDVAVGAHLVYDKTVFVPMKATAGATFAAPVAVARNAYSFRRMSDVDVNIPERGAKEPMRFALIIGNEDYVSFQKDLVAEANVTFAQDDANAFREYAEKLLGIPNENIVMLLNATAAEMRQGLTKLSLIAKNSNGEAELVVYYAGHGLPDEQTKEPRLIPVDVSGKFASLGISLKEFYGYLTQYPSRRVTVFLDACFTGEGRAQGLMASRGIRVVPKDELLKGNLIVFSASSGDESALPYFDKHHGFFTYHLLQKLKSSGGNLEYKEMADFLEKQVPLQSVILNSKEQHPRTNISADLTKAWEKWTFK